MEGTGSPRDTVRRVPKKGFGWSSWGWGEAVWGLWVGVTALGLGFPSWGIWGFFLLCHAGMAQGAPWAWHKLGFSSPVLLFFLEKLPDPSLLRSHWHRDLSQLRNMGQAISSSSSSSSGWALGVLSLLVPKNDSPQCPGCGYGADGWLSVPKFLPCPGASSSPLSWFGSAKAKMRENFNWVGQDLEQPGRVEGVEGLECGRCPCQWD